MKDLHIYIFIVGIGFAAFFADHDSRERDEILSIRIDELEKPKCLKYADQFIIIRNVSGTMLHPGVKMRFETDQYDDGVSMVPTYKESKSAHCKLLESIKDGETGMCGTGKRFCKKRSS